MGLAEDMFGMKLQSFFGACLDTKRITITQIALEWMFYVLVKKHGAEGTAGKALVARDTLFLIKPDNSVFLEDGVCGTAFAAFRHPALLAYDGHSNNGVRI
jgi:hypothetical protein